MKRKNIVISAICVVVVIIVVSTVAIIYTQNNGSPNQVSAFTPDISVTGVSYTVNGGAFNGLVVDLDANGMPTNLNHSTNSNRPGTDSLEDGKDIAPEQTQLLKSGNGDGLTVDDLAKVNIVQYDFNWNEIESTWGYTDPEEINTVDLDEMVKDQIPVALRNQLLTSKIGSVFLWSTQNDDDESKTDVWVVTVIGKDKSIKVDDPNEAKPNVE
jgi:hypothetical protein